ncbi:hypothetical protein ACUR5C_02690 [Aliikangiella sp. IMCC44653]
MEELLERKFLKKYMREKFGFFTLCRELFRGKEAIGATLNNDIKEANDIRAIIQNKLNSNEASLSERAELWSLLLKPKVGALKFWSNFCSSMIALLAAGLLTVRYLSSLFNDNNSWTLVLIFIVLTVLFLLLKSYIEQRASWLEYLGSHMDAIAKLS